MATSIGSQVRGYISSARTAAGKAGDTLGLVTQKLGLESNTYRSSQSMQAPSFNYVRPESPEETSGKSTSDPKLLSFPSDIENVKYFITFTFSEKNYHDYARDSFAKVERDDITYIVRLPMPSSLIDSFKVNYQGTALGTLAGGLLNETRILQDLRDITMNEGPEKVQDAIQNARREASRIKEGFSDTTTSTITAMRAALAFVGSNTLERTADFLFGTTLNPYQSLFFEGPELRSHNFTFKLSPNSLSESITLRRILNVLKTRMLPEKKGVLLKYPDSCIIELSTRTNNNALYTMYRSVLNGVTVNYAPNNVPVFFKYGFEPVEVTLDLNFSEIRPVTREDVLNTFKDKTQLL